MSGECVCERERKEGWSVTEEGASTVLCCMKETVKCASVCERV